MNKIDGVDLVFWSLICGLFGLIIGASIVVFRADDEFNEVKQEAIDHNYARYNPETGEWEWIEKETK